MKYLATLLALFTLLQANAQDSAAAAQRKALQLKFKDKMTYPAVKGGINLGVMPVSGQTEFIDPSLTYELMFDLTEGSVALYKEGSINPGIEEIGRLINLHAGAGVAPSKMKLVVVVHSAAIFSIVRNEEFKKRFGKDNPNIQLIEQLQALGTTFIVCGQTANFREITDENLLPRVKKAFSARTTLTTYSKKGYYTFVINGGH
jgi:intracellular sulfur oxidation DsrE/DsrF family protein